MRNQTDDSRPEMTDVPIHLEPCELRQWLDTHANWVLYLEDDMPAEEIRSLYQKHIQSTCPVEDVIGEIAAHPNTPPDILAELAAPAWRTIHHSLSVNPSLPTGLVQELSKSRSTLVLEYIADRVDAPLDVLIRLARQTRAVAARGIARDRLRRLSQSINRGSENAPEKLPHLPLDMDPCALRKWKAAHKDWVVLLDDGIDPDQIRAIFWRHANSHCACRVVLYAIAEDPRTPNDVLAELCEPRWSPFHIAVGLNLGAPPQLLRRLADSPRWDVLAVVARNGNTPVDVIEELAQQSKYKLAHSAAQFRLDSRRGGTFD